MRVVQMGCTALDLAAWRGHLESVKYLCQHYQGGPAVPEGGMVSECLSEYFSN